MRAKDERLVIVEQSVNAAHRRIDRLDSENELTRKSKHEHSNALQRHSGILELHSESFTNMKTVIEKLTTTMSAVQNTLLETSSRDTTLRWVGKTIFQLAAFAGTVVGIIKYMGS